MDYLPMFVSSLISKNLIDMHDRFPYIFDLTKYQPLNKYFALND